MRNKQYKAYSYRLEDKTDRAIKNLASENGVSKNLLFKGLIYLVEQYGLPKMQHYNEKKKKAKGNA